MDLGYEQKQKEEEGKCQKWHDQERKKFSYIHLSGQGFIQKIHEYESLLNSRTFNKRKLGSACIPHTEI